MPRPLPRDIKVIPIATPPQQNVCVCVNQIPVFWGPNQAFQYEPSTNRPGQLDSDHTQVLWEQDHTKSNLGREGVLAMETVIWMEGCHH